MQDQLTCVLRAIIVSKEPFINYTEANNLGVFLRLLDSVKYAESRPDKMAKWLRKCVQFYRGQSRPIPDVVYKRAVVGHHIITLITFSGKCNQRSRVHPSVRLSVRRLLNDQRCLYIPFSWFQTFLQIIHYATSKQRSDQPDSLSVLLSTGQKRWVIELWIYYKE